MAAVSALIKRIERLSHELLDEETWEHTQRVRKRALLFAASEHLSEDQKQVLEIAALLHDICVANGIPDHGQEGAEQARRILINLDLPTDVINRVCHCIETHNEFAKTRPQTPEAKILSDADAFEFVGPLGIVRIALGSKRSESDSARSVKDRILITGKKRAEQLYTEAGKKAFNSWWEREKQFFDDFEHQLAE